MSQLSTPGPAYQEPVYPPPPAPFQAPAAAVPVQSAASGSMFRITAGVVSIAIGFWGGSASLALHSMSGYMGPRFAWLAFLLGAAALCSIITGFVQIIRHRRRDLRVPALSVAFAAISVLGYVAVFVALPVMSPMLGGLVLAATGIILIALTIILDAIYLPTRH